MKIQWLSGTAWGRLGLLTAMAGSTLVGCSPTGLLDAVTPQGDYELSADIPYGTDERQQLDVYRPDHSPGPEGAAGAAPRAAVVFFYGGSWQFGSKADYRFVGEALTQRGLTVVIPDYRVYPEVRYPAFVEDGAGAVRWVYDHAGELGVDRRRIFLMGHSAGAYIAAMLALDGRYLDKVGLSKQELAGTIGISGPYDFLPVTGRLIEIFGGRDRPETQPVSYADGAARPILLFHGDKDTIVYLRNSEHLAARLRAAGAPVTLVVYPELGHLDIMLGLSSVFSGDERLMTEIDRFVDGTAAPTR